MAATVLTRDSEAQVRDSLVVNPTSRAIYDAVLFGNGLPTYTTLYVVRPQAWSLPLRELQIVFILIFTPPVMMYLWILKIGFAFARTFWYFVNSQNNQADSAAKIVTITRVRSVICALWVAKPVLFTVFEKPSPYCVPSQGLYSKCLSMASFIIRNYIGQSIDLRYLVAPPQILIEQLPNDIYFENVCT